MVHTGEISIIVQSQDTFGGFEFTDPGTLCDSTGDSKTPQERNIRNSAWVVMPQRYLREIPVSGVEGRFDENENLQS